MWPRTYRTAVNRQLELRDRVLLRGAPRRVRLVAGADISYDRGSDIFFAAVVLLDARSLATVEEASATGRSPFPYIPGLLSFREGPLLLRALRRLRQRPDLCVFDGHGLAHPRRFGIACHLGLLLDLPSFGCGKSRLVGTHDAPRARVGSRTPLYHERRRLGTVLRTRTGVKPVFISPGHRMSHEASVRWALRLCAGYRIPEPTRRAHILANAHRTRR